MSVKPITLWSHWAGPNPMKVSTVLEALGLPYEIKLLEFSEVKTDTYLKLNPNGRLPTIQDPNTGLTLWEVCEAPTISSVLMRSQSGAIIQYLVEQYDQKGTISYKTMPEKYLTQQWLAFQISGKHPWLCLIIL